MSDISEAHQLHLFFEKFIIFCPVLINLDDAVLVCLIYTQSLVLFNSLPNFDCKAHLKKSIAIEVVYTDFRLHSCLNNLIMFNYEYARR